MGNEENDKPKNTRELRPTRYLVPSFDESDERIVRLNIYTEKEFEKLKQQENERRNKNKLSNTSINDMPDYVKDAITNESNKLYAYNDVLKEELKSGKSNPDINRIKEAYNEWITAFGETIMARQRYAKEKRNGK